MAYLEQSTRYVPYTDRPDGRWNYHVPSELDGTLLRAQFVRTLDDAFETYARWIPAMEDHFRAKYPQSPTDSDGVYKSVIRAKALDTLRGLLPAATTSNVGLFGTGQAFEGLLLRMLAHPLAEVRDCGTAMLAELRHVIPAFLARVDQPSRGGRWIGYLSETKRQFEQATLPFLDAQDPQPADEVTLTDFDPDGEIKVVAAALYAASSLPDAQLQTIARRMSADDRAALLRTYVGDARESTPQAGARVRAHDLSLRRPDGLRCLPRSSAPSPVDTRMAAAQARAKGYTEPAAIEEAGALLPTGVGSWSSRRRCTNR